MRLVVDANVLLSGIIRDSLTRRLLLDERLDLFAPEHLLTEVEKHALRDEEIQAKTKLGPKELKTLFELLLRPIKTVFVDEKTLVAALKLVTHPEDAPYLAAAMMLGCPVWSNDSDLSKQAKVPVISTKSLVKALD